MSLLVILAILPGYGLPARRIMSFDKMQLGADVPMPPLG
jgi:hypothetical protein